MIFLMIITILRLSLTLLPLCVSLWSMGGCSGKKKEQKKEITSSMIGAASELRIEKPPLSKVVEVKKEEPASIKKEEPVRKLESDKTKEEEQQDTKKGENEKNKSCKIIPYPEVKEPTLSQKKKREEELDKEKKDKIAKGFYQASIASIISSKSDEDDTLEKINSLKEEESEKSKKNQSAKYKSKQG
uniref:Lipoprotein n=1 Tax=Heterorhabditis bacteriophora TaxID=37862 RepID=A0A1I7WPV8_HETBA